MNGLENHIDSLQQALALISSGNPADALQLLSTIPADSSFYPHAMHVHGIAHAIQGRTAQAIEMFEQALAWLADNEELLANLSRAYAAETRFAEALVLLDKIAATGNAGAAIYADRAAVLEKLGKDVLAIDSYDQAIKLDSSYFNAWTGKGNLLHKIGKYEEALSCQDHGIGLRPDHALARSGRASTLDKLGRMNEGLAEHRRAQLLDPEHAAIWYGQGVGLVLLHRLEEGLRCFDRALGIDPTHLQAMINRASVLAELGQREESLRQFDIALQHASEGSRARAQALTFMGMIKLALGDPAGWAGYEHRLHADPETAARNAQAERWSGTEALAGKRILLWSEQGYGDTIQFCRYSSSLAALGATVLVEVPGPLSTLCTSLPVSAIFHKGASLPEHDFQIPMMSMPLALQAQPQLTGIPCPDGYLHADPRFIEKWKQAIGSPRNRLKIGIACSGARRHPRNALRSLPLQKMLPLSEVAELVILQPELEPDDLAIAAANPAIIRPSLDSNDFSDVAGLIANLDLVITVDTSIAHLAGAMRVPVWILLPWSAEWRWMTDRTDSPWYESARLFRQPARGDWDAVIRDVLHALNS